MGQFPQILSSLVLVGVLCGGNYTFAQALDQPSTDRLINLLTTAHQQQWQKIATPQLIQRVAHTFLGSKYTGGLLDRSTQEQLVLSLQEFDCILFVEAVVAIVQIIQDQKFPIGDTSNIKAYFETYPPQFAQQIQHLRYRQGNLTYCDRLHYFTDWVYENQQRGILKDITRDLGGIRDNLPLNFMSQNRQSYPQLRTNNQEWECIKQRELLLAKVARFYVPIDGLPAVYSQLRSGDIIGIATKVKGLDVTHTGFVYIANGQVGLIHASPSGQVVIAPDLERYTRRVPESKGIVVVRVGS
jgi:hypothetical protein